MRTLISLLLALVACYGAVAALIWLLQSRFVYYPDQPTRQLQATPRAAGLDYEDVFVPASDEIRLHGWYVPHATGPTVLYFHGNAGNISHRIERLRLFHELGCAVLMLDYRGYGQSEGKPGEQGTYRDAMAAWRYLTESRGIEPHRIVIHGTSLGGAVAVWLASEVEPGGLVIESSFTSIAAMARKAFPFLPAGLARIRYDSLSRIGAVRSPVLLMHSPQDSIIPYSHGRALHEAAPPGTRFVTLAGDHNETLIASRDIYIAALRQFLNVPGTRR